MDVDEELLELRRDDNAYYDSVTPELAGVEFCKLLTTMKAEFKDQPAT